MQGSVLVVSGKWQIDRRTSGILSILVKAAEKGACNCGYYNGTTTNANTEANTYKQNENEDKGKDTEKGKVGLFLLQ